MVRAVLEFGADHLSLTVVAGGLFVFVSVLVALCAKHSSGGAEYYEDSAGYSKALATAKSIANAKKFVSKMVKKSIPFILKRRDGEEAEAVMGSKDAEGLWQRTILMGEKCSPPEFPGVIYYDSYGNQMAGPPLRSLRASPFPEYLVAGVAKDERQLNIQV